MCQGYRIKEVYKMINLTVFVVIILIFSLPFLAFAQETVDMVKSISDAERDAKLTDITTWNGVGCLFGVFGMIAASIIDPPVPAAKLLGKSPEYVVFYTEAYRSNLKRKRIEAAGHGCIIGNGLIFGSLILFYNVDSLFE